MKLFSADASPFARKVRACAVAREIDRQIEIIPTDPHVYPPALLAANPLSKIPCLITSDGRALFDSPVICEFLDTIGDAPPMFPPKGGPRWKALKQQAVGDGIMDAAVFRRGLRGLTGREAEHAHHKGAIDRALDLLEMELPHRGVDIGTVSVACALGYLDLRFAGEDWRGRRPVLAAWFAAISAEPALAATAPKG